MSRSMLWLCVVVVGCTYPPDRTPRLEPAPDGGRPRAPAQVPRDSAIGTFVAPADLAVPGLPNCHFVERARGVGMACTREAVKPAGGEREFLSEVERVGADFQILSGQYPVSGGGHCGTPIGRRTSTVVTQAGRPIWASDRGAHALSFALRDLAPEADGAVRPELVIQQRGEPWVLDVVDVVDGVSRVVFAHTDESVYRGFMATKSISFTRSADGTPEILFENHLYADRIRVAERFRFNAATHTFVKAAGDGLDPYVAPAPSTGVPVDGGCTLARDHGFAYLDCPVGDRLERVSLCTPLDAVTPSFEPLQCTFVRSARRDLVFVSRRRPHHASSIRLSPDVEFRFVELLPERSGPRQPEVLVSMHNVAGVGGRRVPWTVYRYANPGGGLPLPNDFHLDSRVIVRRGPRGSFEAATPEQLALRRHVGVRGPYEQQRLSAARRTRMACYDLRRERYFERVMTLEACVAANEGAR